MENIGKSFQSQLRSYIIIVTLLTMISGCAEIQFKMGDKIDPTNIESVLHINKSTKEDVRSVYGEPDGKGIYVSPINGESSNMWTYFYADGTLSTINDTNLLIYFDDDIYQGYLWFSNNLVKSSSQ